MSPKAKKESENLGTAWFLRNLKYYLAYALIWTPIICAIFVSIFGDLAEYLRELALSLVIAEVTMTGCFWASATLSIPIQRIRVRFGLPSRVSGGLGHIFISGLFLIPSMYLGFKAATAIAPIIGIGFRAPDMGSYKTGIVIGLFSMTIFSLHLMWRDLELEKQRSLAEKSLLETETLKAKISALTAQMNPHFLFNSLNSIASLIHSAPEKAEDLTVELGNMFRRVLDASKSDTHALERELDLCRSYLEIERTRFPDKINFSVNCSPEIKVSSLLVPVLCIQPFVENAIKHGLLQKNQPGSINIEVLQSGNNVCIEIRDDGVGLGSSTSRTGSGTAIANCRARLNMIFGENGTVAIERGDQAGTVVKIRFPIDRGRA